VERAIDSSGGNDQFDGLGYGLLRRFPPTDERHHILPRSSSYLTKQNIFQKVPKGGTGGPDRKLRFLGRLICAWPFGISRRRPEKSNSRECQYLDQRPNVPAIFPLASEPNLRASRAPATRRRA
jgi:hypothetical protein